MTNDQRNQNCGIHLSEIAAVIGGEVHGNADTIIYQVASLASAKVGDISFVSNPRYRHQLKTTHASAVIIPPQFIDDTKLPCIVHPDSYTGYALAASMLNPTSLPPPGIHPSAIINSPVPETVSIGANVTIGCGVSIAENTVIHPGCVIGDNVQIGANCLFYPNVVIYLGCKIGHNVIIHSGAIIGADGFGFANSKKKWVKIPQTGAVIIGNNVEIGANTTIDRGALDNTIIESGVKLDNQIQIAHNCIIGENTVIAACAGIAGSAHIGKRCMIGGAARIVGHLEIVDDSVISPNSMVMKNITKADRYTGIYPLETHQQWLQGAARLRRLKTLDDRLAALEEKLSQLEKNIEHDGNS